MRFVAPTKALADALVRVTKPFTRRSFLPILEHVLIETDGEDTVTFTMTDLDVTAVTWVEGATVLEEGACLAPARTMRDTVKADRSSTMPVATDDDRVKVGGAAFPQGNMPDWPKLEPDPFALAHSRNDLPAGFLALVERVAVAASKDDSRPVLCQVRFVPGGEQDDGTVAEPALAATDSYRLSFAAIDDGPWPDGLPLRMVQKARAVCGEPYLLSWQNTPAAGNVALAGPYGLIAARQIEGAFPNWRKLLPGSIPNLLEADVKEAIDQLAQHAKIAEDHIPVRVLVAPHTPAVTLLTIRQNVGTVETRLDTAIMPAQEEMTSAFNCRYLTDGIRTMGVGNRFRLYQVDPSKPALISNGGAVSYLLMPVRL